jgi:hypothetical protein
VLLQPGKAKRTGLATQPEPALPPGSPFATPRRPPMKDPARKKPRLFRLRCSSPARRQRRLRSTSTTLPTRRVLRSALVNLCHRSKLLRIKLDGTWAVNDGLRQLTADLRSNAAGESESHGAQSMWQQSVSHEGRSSLVRLGTGGVASFRRRREVSARPGRRALEDRGKPVHRSLELSLKLCGPQGARPPSAH